MKLPEHSHTSTLRFVRIDLQDTPRLFHFPLPVQNLGTVTEESSSFVGRHENQIEFCVRMNSEDDIAVDTVGESVYTNRFPHVFIKHDGPLHKYRYSGMREAFFFIYHASLHGKLEETEALLRFPGLQTVDILDSLYDKETGGLYDGPLCPDWLVLIANAFVEKLGGFEAVQRKMSPFPAHAYEGGALLQTGESPCPGGPGQAKGLEGYYHMGKVIDPIRWKQATAHLYSRRLGLQHDKKLGRTWAERFAPKQCRVLTFSPRKTGATS